MFSKLNDVKLIPLEIRLPSVELLLKKYGKHLVNKNNPGHPTCKSADQNQIPTDRQGRVLENASAKEETEESDVDPPTANVEEDASSDSDLDYPANSVKQPAKLVIGYKLLQNKKLKQNNDLLEGQCHKQNAAPKQVFTSDISESAMNKNLKRSDKPSDVRNPEKSPEPFDEKLKWSTETKNKSRDNKLTKSGADKSVDSGSQVSTQIRLENFKISEPHASTSKSFQKSSYARGNSDVGSEICAIRNVEPESKGSNSPSVPAADGDISSKQLFKVGGGLNNNFSLKFRELKIVLHRIDGHKLLCTKAPEIGRKSQGEKLLNHQNRKEDSKEHSSLVSSKTLPLVQSESQTLKGTDLDSATSPVFNEKLSNVTLILYQSCKCDCGLDFSTPELLLSHSLDSHIGNAPGKGPNYNFKCKFCDIRFLRWTSQKKHEHQFHNISKPVPSVDSGSNAVNSFVRPVIPLGKLTCELCGEVFVNQSNLSLHNALMHSSDSLSQCQICKEKFKSEDLLKFHNKVHEVQESNSRSTQNVQPSQSQFQKCSKCDQRFNTVILLKLHERQKHSGVSHHPCNSCSASYSTKAQLNRHIKLEHTLSLQKCNDQIQRKRPGPKSKVAAKKQKFCVVQPFRADSSRNYASPDLDGSPVKGRAELTGPDEPLLVECDSYISNSIHFNETEDEYMDDPLEDPLADPLLLPESNKTLEESGHEDTQGLVMPSQVYPSSTDMQPSLLALLEGADPNDPNYYIRNGEETVTLNYMPPEDIKCPHCTKTFTDQIQLKLHSQIHSARIKKPYICMFPDCSERFDSSANLQRHRQEAHARNHVRKQVREPATPVPANLPAEAPVMSEPHGEAAAKSAVQELGIKSNSDVFTCKICGEKFDKVAAFVKHEWSHAGDLTCKHCPARFETMLSLKKHISRHKRVELPQLVKNTNSLPIPDPAIPVSNDKTEIESKLIKAFKCHYCKATCKTLTRYTRHMAAHHEENPNGKYKYKCQYCWKKFNNCNRFTVHIYNHSKPASIRCRVCPKTFKSMIELTEHRKTHVNIYSCSYCYKKFDRKNTFESHLVMHSKEKLFSCKFCSETFYRKQTLLIHIRRLHNKKHSQAHSTSQTDSPTPTPNLAPSEFSQRYEMAKTAVEELSVEISAASEALITGKFPCRYCAERFNQKTKLRQHHEIHRIHRCVMCPKKYLEYNHLASHLKLVHPGSFEYRCEPCLKSFTKFKQLHQHNGTKNHLRRLEESNKQQDSNSYDFRNANYQEEESTEHMLFFDDESISSTSQQENESVVLTASTDILEPIMAESNVWVTLPASSDATTLSGSSSAVIQENVWTISADDILDPAEGHFSLEIEPSVPHTCHQCSAIFTNSRDLSVHVRLSHDSNSDSVVSLCRPCNRIFMSLQDFKEHTTTVHGHSEPLSEESSPIMQSESDLLDTEPDVNHTSSGVLEELKDCTLGMTCWTCGAMLPGIIALSAHMSVKHGTYTCPYDGSTFASESELLTHFRQHMEKNPCRCKVCKPNTVQPVADNPSSVHSSPAAGTCVNSAQEEDDDVTIIEDIPATKVVDDDDDDITIVEERFNNPSVQYGKSKTKSSAASASSTSQKSFSPILTKCVSCRQDFMSKEVYETHICVSDEALPGKTLENQNHQFHCPMCPRTFLHQEKLDEHVNLHKHLRGLVSKLNWGESSQLRKQNRAILNTPAPIDISNKRTPPLPTRQCYPKIMPVSETLNNSLTVRDKNNSGNTKGTDILSCDKCYKKFKTSEELKDHVEKYQHRADHSCPICRMDYSYKEFIIHMKQKHPGEKIYSCSNICQIHFRTPKALNRHMNSTQHTSRVRMHELYIAQQLRSGNSVLDFECPKCNAGFSSEVLVLDHMVNSEEYSGLSSPSCRLNAANSVNKGGTRMITVSSPDVQNLPIASQSKSKTSTSSVTGNVLQIDKPSRGNGLPLNQSEIMYVPSDDSANNPEDEQETDVIWSSSPENDEDELDDTPVFQIVTHAPL